MGGTWGGGAGWAGAPEEEQPPKQAAFKKQTFGSDTGNAQPDVRHEKVSRGNKTSVF